MNREPLSWSRCRRGRTGARWRLLASVFFLLADVDCHILVRWAACGPLLCSNTVQPKHLPKTISTFPNPCHRSCPTHEHQPSSHMSRSQYSVVGCYLSNEHHAYNVKRRGPYIISRILISGPETWELVSQAPRFYISLRWWGMSRSAVQQWKNLSAAKDLCACFLLPANCVPVSASSVQARCREREMRERTSLRHPAQVLLGYSLEGKQP